MTFRTKRRQHMRDYCDRLFRKRIRERDENTCQAGNLAWGVYCGGPLEVAHFEPRRKMRVRWSDYNAALLCRNHHAWIDTHEADKWEWVQTFLGPELYAVLKEAGREPWDKSYDDVLQRLKGEVVPSLRSTE